MPHATDDVASLVIHVIRSAPGGQPDVLFMPGGPHEVEVSGPPRALARLVTAAIIDHLEGVSQTEPGPLATVLPLVRSSDPRRTA